jgi:Flp pilus assembly pilin Flp
MLKFIKDFWQDEDGMGTVEVVVIVAVLVGIALLFRNAITRFVNTALGKIFRDDIIDNSLDPTKIK